MVALVSAFVLATTQGLQGDFVQKWLRSCMTTWPVAFLAVALVAPRVRSIVAQLTAADRAER
jgi:hypothetical protein